MNAIRRLAILFLAAQLAGSAAVHGQDSPFPGERGADLDKACRLDIWDKRGGGLLAKLVKVPRDQVVGFALYTHDHGVLKMSAQLFPLQEGEAREAFAAIPGLAALGRVNPFVLMLSDNDTKLSGRITKDAFVRACGADYSVPPGLVNRRVHVRVSLAEVIVFLEGREIARHTRSYVPADVVLDPKHAHALRAAREAEHRLRRGDVPLEVPDLSRYDALLGVTP